MVIEKVLRKHPVTYVMLTPEGDAKGSTNTGGASRRSAGARGDRQSLRPARVPTGPDREFSRYNDGFLPGWRAGLREMLLDLNKLHGQREHFERTFPPSAFEPQDSDYRVAAPVELVLDVTRLGDQGLRPLRTGPDEAPGGLQPVYRAVRGARGCALRPPLCAPLRERRRGRNRGRGRRPGHGLLSRRHGGSHRACCASSSCWRCR